MWRQESISLVHAGETLHTAGYDLTFHGVTQVAGKNYTATRGDFAVSHDGHFTAEMQPERRYYPVQSRFVTQAAIRTNIVSDLYVTLGAVDASDRSAYVTRIYHHPLVPFIWIGAVIMTAGGILSLSSRSNPAGRIIREPL